MTPSGSVRKVNNKFALTTNPLKPPIKAPYFTPIELHMHNVLLSDE